MIFHTVFCSIILRSKIFLQLVLTFLLRRFFQTFHVFFSIFHKTDCNHHNYSTNRKCSNNTNRLNIVHRAFCKQQSNWQQDQQNTPHQLNALIRLLTILQCMIAVAGGCQSNRIKRSRIESNYRQKNNYHNNRCTRHRFDDRYNHAIQISAFQ